MGQYFRAVNLDKREYVDPWNLGCGAKFWEWCANTEARVFPYLLRKSSEADAGGDLKTIDWREYGRLQEEDGLSPSEALDRAPRLPVPEYAGRWAGDRILLVGDYDESGLWDEVAESFVEISAGLIEEFNRFIESPDLRIGRPPGEVDG